MENKNEIQKSEPNELQHIDPASPAGIMIQLASSGGDFDVEKFGKMLEFQERHEANEARKVFASDFATVQANIEAVVKTKINPQTKSKYAGLENVLEMSKPVYTEHGFSIIFYEGETKVAESIRVCADVLHKAGHKQTYHFDVPLDGKGIKGNANMTKIHGKASSVSYGRRYLLCMIWNIPTPDDDGNSAGKKPEPPKPIPKPTMLEVRHLTKVYEYFDEHANPEIELDKNKLCAASIKLLGHYPKSQEDEERLIKELNEKDIAA
jgi:hypothetical protein